MRHNAVRDMEAKLMRKVCNDVKLEPMLIPTNAERATCTTAERARLDVSGHGVWSQYERTFADIAVTHPTAESHVGKKMISCTGRLSKRRRENTLTELSINTERGTLTPLVFSTTGGMGPECSRFNKRLAELRREGGSTHFLDKK